MSTPTSGERTAQAAFDRALIAQVRQREQTSYRSQHPSSARLAAVTAEHYFAGVPMHWMSDWPLPFPLFVASAQGARITDADGHTYRDFCLGDSGALFGHSPAPVAHAVAAQATRGLTTMLPGAQAAWVGAELARRFGLPVWQIATTASDANRFLLRWARAATNRRVIVVFDGCYHGAVDETQVRLLDGKTIAGPGLVGSATDHTHTTRVVEFNNVAALRAALAPGDVAAVLCEPAMTNIGMVLPDPDFHRELRTLTRAHRTLLLLDETHTLSTGPGGYTRDYGLDPDALVIGKAIAGGLPCAVTGVSAALAARMRAAWEAAGPGRTGIGTTLSANPLQLAALRANLEFVMTDAAYATMSTRARTLAESLRTTINNHRLPWSVTQLGARLEIQYRATLPRTGSEAEAGFAPDISHALHLYLLNRGIIVTPFHNMCLVSPETSDADVTALVSAIEGFIRDLKSG
jgi:glutamate-1-semialdehyde 2,1-aminomutase